MIGSEIHRTVKNVFNVNTYNSPQYKLYVGRVNKILTAKWFAAFKHLLYIILGGQVGILQQMKDYILSVGLFTPEWMPVSILLLSAEPLTCTAYKESVFYAYMYFYREYEFLNEKRSTVPYPPNHVSEESCSTDNLKQGF